MTNVSNDQCIFIIHLLHNFVSLMADFGFLKVEKGHKLKNMHISSLSGLSLYSDYSVDF